MAASCGTCSGHCGNTEGVSSTFPVLVTTVFQVYPLRLQPLNRDQHRHHHCPHLLGTATLVPLAVHCLVTETHLPGQPYPSSVLQQTSNVSIKFTQNTRVLKFTCKNSSQNQHKIFNFTNLSLKAYDYIYHQPIHCHTLQCKLRSTECLLSKR